MYVTMFPCNECSKLLIQAGIREIVFYEDKAAPPVKYSSPNEAPGSDIRWAIPRNSRLSWLVLCQHWTKRLAEESRTCRQQSAVLELKS